MSELLTAARPYAKALYEAVGNQAQSWLPVMDVCKSLGDSEESRRFLNSHGLNADTFNAVSQPILKASNISNLPEKYNRFINLLSDKGRFSILPEIAQLFIDEVNKSNDKVVAEIISARELTEESKSLLIGKLESKYAKKVEATVTIDQSLIGGAVIKVGDAVIDGSVKGRLEQLTKALN